jgi:hypothetical protein
VLRRAFIAAFMEAMNTDWKPLDKVISFGYNLVIVQFQ